MLLFHQIDLQQVRDMLDALNNDNVVPDRRSGKTVARLFELFMLLRYANNNKSYMFVNSHHTVMNESIKMFIFWLKDNDINVIVNTYIGSMQVKIPPPLKDLTIREKFLKWAFNIMPTPEPPARIFIHFASKCDDSRLGRYYDKVILD